MEIVAILGVGLIMLSYGSVCVLSVVWVLNGGEMAAWKPASWVSRTLFWHGVWVLASLMLGGGIAVAMTLAQLAWRG